MRTSLGFFYSLSLSASSNVLQQFLFCYVLIALPFSDPQTIPEGGLSYPQVMFSFFIDRVFATCTIWHT